MMQTVLQSITLPFLGEAAAPGTSAMTYQFVMIGLMVAAMWFLVFAPQRKKQKEHVKMLAALSTGDDVVTVGGVYGTISNIKDDRYVLKISDNTKIEIGKSFIQSKA